jgi:hypothetical protein
MLYTVQALEKARPRFSNWAASLGGRGHLGGIMLKAGQILYDNDPRYRGRKVEVVRVEGAYAVCLSGPRQVKVRLDHIFGDGKPRRSGYSTVTEDDSLDQSRPRSGIRGVP